MSSLKSKKKSSRKQMTNRSRMRYHFQVMEHFDNLRRIEKAGGKGSTPVKRSSGRGQ